MIKREEFVVKNRDGACTPEHGISVLSFKQNDKFAKAKRVTVVIETEEKPLGQVLRETAFPDGTPWEDLRVDFRSPYQAAALAVIEAAVERGLVKRV